MELVVEQHNKGFFSFTICYGKINELVNGMYEGRSIICYAFVHTLTHYIHLLTRYNANM